MLMNDTEDASDSSTMHKTELTKKQGELTAQAETHRQESGSKCSSGTSFRMRHETK